MLNLVKSIWNKRNVFVHGKDEQEARENQRQAILEKEKALFQNPLKLAT